MKMSLGKKLTALVIVNAVILGMTCITVNDYVFRKVLNDEYKITADSLAATAAVMIDGDKLREITDKVTERYYDSENKIDNTKWETPEFEEYSEQFIDLMEDDAYIEVRDQLRKLQDASEADCVYTIFIDTELKNAVYIVDAAYEEDEIVTPGCFDFIEDVCYPYLDDLSQGFPAFITNTPEYGNVVTACMPVYDSDQKIVCFASVDLSMEEVLATENDFITKLTIILTILIALICAMFIPYVHRRITNPIKMLSSTARQYGQKNEGEKNVFNELRIHTGDEIEILHKSMIQMENDIDNYITSLTRTEQQLTSVQQQAQRDSLTGIRNRTAYDKEIEKLEEEAKNGLTEYGIGMIDLNFLKYLNDTYGHEQGNTAIIGLTKLVCKVFAHSPVFRIGGDEFAVILKNDDYKNINELEKIFNDRLSELAADESLLPWEKISAAFGYAMFDPATDKSTDDVFKRADQNMYERKKAMKAERTIY